ncbi:hypothetical protein AAC387_Pa07g1287 [Persea americana]
MWEERWNNIIDGEPDDTAHHSDEYLALDRGITRLRIGRGTGAMDASRNVVEDQSDVKNSRETTFTRYHDWESVVIATSSPICWRAMKKNIPKMPSEEPYKNALSIFKRKHRPEGEKGKRRRKLWLGERRNLHFRGFLFLSFIWFSQRLISALLQSIFRNGCREYRFIGSIGLEHFLLPDLCGVDRFLDYW